MRSAYGQTKIYIKPREDWGTTLHCAPIQDKLLTRRPTCQKVAFIDVCTIASCHFEYNCDLT